MTCRKIVELVTAYLENALPADEHRRVAAHLADCEDCLTYVEQLAATTDLLARLPQTSLQVDACAELLAHWATSGPQPRD